MSKISSNWKLTFDPAGVPLVLLDYGDWIEGELRFPLRRGLEVVNLADSANPFLRPTGNAVITIAFDRYRDETLDTTARRAVMESLVAILPLARKPMFVEVSGIVDRYWRFESCFITEHNPGRWLDAPVARRIQSYSLTCTGFTQVGP